MTTTAIQALRDRAASVGRQLDTEMSNAAAYRRYADKYAARAVKLRAELADLNEAIAALSYPTTNQGE